MKAREMDNKTLVIYYDNGDKPIFRNCFRESGLRWHSWLKNDISFRLYAFSRRNKWVSRHASNLIYYFPEDTDGLIILFDTKLSRYYLDRIRRKNPRAKIVVWYWNAVDNEDMLNVYKAVDVWSYSPSDCEKYGLLYNPQFFFDSIAERYRGCRDQGEMRGERSFIFMGRDKGRSEYLRTIADEIKKSGWGCRTDYLSTCKTDRPERKDVLYSSGFPYEKYMETALKYQGILDVVYKENSGLSLRTMESIFFHKKLITTNPAVTSYDFYDENNIYVWGRSDMSPEEFLSRPYRPVPDSICRHYLMTSWLARIKAYYGME